MQADKTLLQMKYSRVVALFAAQQGLTTEEALDFFYHSETYQELREGIADLHCRSDQYVADELAIEYRDSRS
ncbi:MAG: DUF3791 domain-containing protein [Lentisphaeria bacterium]|nr:DUF3791 domain-containing protein [Lentisphaeria bacterium]